MPWSVSKYPLEAGTAIADAAVSLLASALHCVSSPTLKGACPALFAALLENDDLVLHAPYGHRSWSVIATTVATLRAVPVEPDSKHETNAMDAFFYGLVTSEFKSSSALRLASQ